MPWKHQQRGRSRCCSILLTLAIAALALLASGNAMAKTVQVPEECPTLEMALENASDGDIIVLGYGYYAGRLQVEPNVTIAGVGRPLTPFNITGGGYTLVLERQKPLPDYHYMSYGLTLALEKEGERITFLTVIPLEEAGVLDPLSIGFYRIEGEKVIPLSTTYVVEKEIRVSASIDRSGAYALLGRRWFPFWPAIQGITTIVLVAAAIVALYLYRGRRKGTSAER